MVYSGYSLDIPTYPTWESGFPKGTREYDGKLGHEWVLLQNSEKLVPLLFLD